MAKDLSGTNILAGMSTEALTNSLGEGSISLMRGIECDVVINETSIVRRVTVPDQAKAELADLIEDADDLFTIQRAMPAQPIRRSI